MGWNRDQTTALSQCKPMSPGHPPAHRQWREARAQDVVLASCGGKGRGFGDEHAAVLAAG